MILKELPFHLGITEEPHNPVGIPDTYPFELGINTHIESIVQIPSQGLLNILDEVYRQGGLIGTPLSGDLYGRPYVDDILSFINKQGKPSNAAVLEIGAGNGYLTRQLINEGYDAVGIEPCLKYTSDWKLNNVSIINDFFPSKYISQQYDMVCSFAVLEHIANPLNFLRDVREYLKPDGVLVISVPDCEAEISTGDPAMLLHEHFSYFNIDSLMRLFYAAGYEAHIEKSLYGRCLYAAAKMSDSMILPHKVLDPTNYVYDYLLKCEGFIDRVKAAIQQFSMEGSIGVFCATRGLALLDKQVEMSFYDDNSAFQGKYIPPYKSTIESRAQLHNSPVDNLLVLSRTFGRQIADSLRREGYTKPILLIEEM